MPRTRMPLVSACVLALGVAAGGRAEPPPSVLLFVLDTVRYDAVSANGTAIETTPALDRLARDGVRYTHAYAAAPWTLPSHASLFTGLYPSAHGVGWPETTASDELVMLAERLAAAGYDTAAFVENPWLEPAFNMMQGFETAPVPDAFVDVVDDVDAWARRRSPSRPFFLFVNVVDAHSPYIAQDENPWVPCCPTTGALDALPRDARAFFCRTAGHEWELAALHGLYLADVAAADRKLGLVLDALRRTGADDRLVTVVTSDHGELFGEHRLVEHMLGLYEELVHVPLVVHGLAGVAPAVVDDPVSLIDVVPSVLAWTGTQVAADLPGRRLAVATEGVPRGLVAEWNDPGAGALPDRRLLPRLGRRLIASVRAQCGPDDRVQGGMRTLIRYPLKLVRYDRYPQALYDLAADPREERDLVAARPGAVWALSKELDLMLAARRPPEPPAPRPVAPTVLDRLRALGYLGGK